ncbi:dienelactone hydrolase family protein [Marimonas arenosa]|uniref:Dienelactone hydrolase family protein n=1 Tax=Marimonas arenosa TaxID=1795305 RepID=A0AAE4B885_9RHOB|nr:dienelactone hydrolase family protein [Marimonas arenosa]MDQ2092331.1 dienelactone hydrolase family protein [Marimonas arenosa]
MIRILSTRTIRHVAWAALMVLTAGAPPVAAQDETAPAADTVTGRTFDAPVNSRPIAEKFWWSDDWYDRGVIEVPDNFAVTETRVSYTNPADGTEVPAILYRPEGDGPFPGVLFQHGRRGLDVYVQRLARRMAARGFLVLAPDVYEARFIEVFPLEHDPATEGDVDAGVDFLLSHPDLKGDRICLYSHTRGGYYTLRVAVEFARQNTDVACYVSFYPHWQDPNAVEPLQVYRYHSDLDRLEIPTMVFIGEYEQYQRRRSIETAVRFMKEAGRDVRLIVYPGVGRGFDFRPPNVRTFADDLATRDATLRTAAFLKRHLE